jgi:hypothetical protein
MTGSWRFSRPLGQQFVGSDERLDSSHETIVTRCKGATETRTDTTPPIAVPVALCPKRSRSKITSRLRLQTLRAPDLPGNPRSYTPRGNRLPASPRHCKLHLSSPSPLLSLRDRPRVDESLYPSNACNQAFMFRLPANSRQSSSSWTQLARFRPTADPCGLIRIDISRPEPGRCDREGLESIGSGSSSALREIFERP